MSDTSPLVMWFGFIATAGVIIALFGSRNASTETSILLQECIADGGQQGETYLFSMLLSFSSMNIALQCIELFRAYRISSRKSNTFYRGSNAKSN
jgi:hypothetical protein